MRARGWPRWPSAWSPCGPSSAAAAPRRDRRLIPRPAPAAIRNAASSAASGVGGRAVKIRKHVNPLKSEMLEIPGLARIAPPPGGFLEVELGSADGAFLIQRAPEVPEALLV